MEFRAQVPQLKHIPQYRRPIGALGLGEDFQGRPHGLGVGVVSVVQNGDIPLVNHIHPHLGGDKGLNPRLHLLPGHAEPLPNGAGHAHRVDHVAAQRGHGHRKVVLRGNHPAAQPLGPQLSDFLRRIGGRSVRPAEHHLGREFSLQRAEHGVVPVEDCHPLRRHPVENFLLRLQNARPAAQVFNVGVADVGDHRHIRGGNLGQIVDLPEVIHPHLQHTDLVLGRQTEQGQGKTQLVVEVSLRFQNPELLPQYRGHHVLGGGFAYAASDADDGDGKLLSIRPGHLANGQHGVLHLDIELSRQQHLGDLLGQAAGGAGLQRTGNIPVPVCPLSPQGHEKVSLVDGPAVCLHACDGPLRHSFLSQEPSAGGGQKLPDCHRFHCAFSFFLLVSQPFRTRRDSSMIRWHRLA